MGFGIDRFVIESDIFRVGVVSDVHSRHFYCCYISHFRVVVKRWQQIIPSFWLILTRILDWLHTASKGDTLLRVIVNFLSLYDDLHDFWIHIIYNVAANSIHAPS